MSDTPGNTPRPVDPETGEPYCGQSVAAHSVALILLLAQAGVGFDCRDLYRALVETAEAWRQIGDFKPYTAEANGPGTQFAQEYIQRQEAQFGRDKRASEPDDTPSEPTGNRAYDSLTAAAKRRFN